MPLGPNVLLTRSPTAIAPMKDDYIYISILLPKKKKKKRFIDYLPNEHFRLFPQLLDPGRC
jgi:hypothetical protein